MREWEFEQRLCAHLEANGALVARQLGAGVTRSAGRIVDVLRVEPGPDFPARASLTDAEIPPLAIAADVGPGRARYWKDTVRSLDVNSERARAAIDRAIQIGFLEAERRNGRTYVRQVTRYPTDWFDGLTAIENKPNLDAPGDLETQLRTDVSLALVDRVVVATASHVTGAHRHRWPDAVGIWRFDPGTNTLEVLREPDPLPVGEPGLELLDRRPGRDDIAVVPVEDKAVARRRLAERAYGKGWRPDPPIGCTHAGVDDVAGVGGLPHCSYYDRLIDPATDCGGSCPAFEAGSRPVYDRRAARDRFAPWIADPAGMVRRQGALDWFTADGRDEA